MEGGQLCPLQDICSPSLRPSQGKSCGKRTTASRISVLILSANLKRRVWRKKGRYLRYTVRYRFLINSTSGQFLFPCHLETCCCAGLDIWCSLLLADLDPPGHHLPRLPGHPLQDQVIMGGLDYDSTNHGFSRNHWIRMYLLYGYCNEYRLGPYRDSKMDIVSYMPICVPCSFILD